MKRLLHLLRPTLLASVAVLFSLAGPRFAVAAEDYDHWYVLEIDGARAGWGHMSQETRQDRIVSTNQMHMKIGRVNQEIVIKLDMVFTETLEGEPIGIHYRQNLGVGADSVIEWTWDDGEVSATMRAGGREVPYQTRVPQGDWVLPAKAAREYEAQVEAGAEEVAQMLLQPVPPGQLMAVETTSSNFEKAEVEVFGRVVPALRVKTVTSAMPGLATISYVDDNGVPLKTTTPMAGFGELTMLLADKKLALADVEAPELMVATMIAPDRPVPNARASRKAIYVLSSDKGELTDLPSTASQRFERINAGSGRVFVNVDAPLPARLSEREGALAASAMIDIDDQGIIALAKEAPVDPDAPPAEKAEALRRFVNDYIDEKGFGVGLATASEVCATREGDCSEHGVLLAALLRRHGIPARVATGLLYVDRFAGEQDVFGYHMWTQALLEDEHGTPRWVDLDAVLPPQWPTDATHITLAVSNMTDDDTFHALLDVVPLIGSLQVRVESVD